MGFNTAETSIEKVNVDRQELLSKLQANLKTHRELFAESCRGYEDTKVSRLRALQAATNTAVSNNTEVNRKAVHEAYNAFSQLQRPVDHSESYELAIEIMKWEKKDNVDLSINDFQCYVRDKWNWKEQFRNSVLNYAAAHTHRV